MNTTYILAALLSALAAYNGASWLFSKDTETEDKRRAANKFAGILRSYGLSRIPAIFEDYGVGDYSGIATKIKAIVELFTSGEEVFAKEFAVVFDKVLDAQLGTEAGRALIKAKIASSEPAAPAVAANAVKSVPAATA